MTFYEQLIYAGAFCSILMTMVWTRQLFSKDASFVDVAWAGSIGVLAAFFLYVKSNRQLGDYMIASVSMLWSARLAGYLFLNRIVGKPEDGRYRHLRETMGNRFQLFLFWFFQLQAAAALLFGCSILWALSSNQSNMLLISLAFLIGLISIIGEGLADYQLANFRANALNKGKVCQDGLWNYSRHPNYFFEWLHWWSYVAFCLTTPWWWLTLIQPTMMLIFIFRFTGIPATEAQAVRSRGDEYLKYQQTTSVFVPWFKSTLN